MESSENFGAMLLLCHSKSRNSAIARRTDYLHKRHPILAAGALTITFAVAACSGPSTSQSGAIPTSPNSIALTHRSHLSSNSICESRNLKSHASWSRACKPLTWVLIRPRKSIFGALSIEGRKVIRQGGADPINVRNAQIQPYETPITSVVSGVGEYTTFGVDSTDGTPYDCSFEGVPFSTLSDYSYSASGSIAVPADTSVEDNVFYGFFMQPLVSAITATCTVNGESRQWPPLPISITAPVATLAITYGTVNVDKNYPGYKTTDTLHYGLPVQGTGGVNWTYSAAGGDAGKVSIFQFVASLRTKPTSTTGTGGLECSDNSIPYDGWSRNTDLDAPLMGLGNPAQKEYLGDFSVDDSFDDYFMFLANTAAGDEESLPTAIAHSSWSWQATLNQTATGWSWISNPTFNRGHGNAWYGTPPTWGCVETNGNV
jgi:hypothetical protein